MENCSERDHLSFLCDNCPGQNKNQYIAQAMVYVVNMTRINRVDVRFPYRGHMFLPDDTNFGNIECKMKKKELLYCMDDYVNVISSANSCRLDKKGPQKKIKVHVMKQEEFKEFDIDLLVKRNIDVTGEKFLWTDIHHMRFEKGVMGMFFKEKSFGNDPLREVDFARRGASISELKKYELKNLYKSELKINQDKYNELIEQLEFVPPCYHSFYRELKH